MKHVFKVEGLGQDWLEKEKLSCASRYFEVTCLSVGVFGIICFEGCFHSCLWLSWLNNESYLLPVDAIPKVKVHNWLCALILSVHLLSYTEIIWMNQCLILTFWKLNDWSTFILSFRHSYHMLSFWFFAFIHATKVCGFFLFCLTTNVWLSRIWYLFPGLLKCCHRNLFLPFGPCCSILVCITFSAIDGFLNFFSPLIPILCDFLGLLVWCL